MPAAKKTPTHTGATLKISRLVAASVAAGAVVTAVAVPANAAVPADQHRDPATAALPAHATADSAPNLPCGTTERDDDTSPTLTIAAVTGTVNIRTGTTSQCSIIGTIGAGEAINYHCYVWDAIGRSWTYLHTSENEYGWVLNTSLPDPYATGWHGSTVRC
ncbi:hypothetical protein ACH4O2_19955 [Streptomyces sp. NPDC017083]|uniref:hypothetical protein n=1 Tax=Streptomyces sp. NPDC017083 TaxID=3364975 RepID=UPI00378D4334